MSRMKTSAAIMLTACLFGGAPLAQTPVAEPPVSPPNSPPIASLRVQVVLSRHEGDKKIGSVPYMLSVSTHSKASQLRMGARVPISTRPITGDAPVPVSSFNYENVGTSIDCYAVALSDGRYQLTIGIDDSSPYEGDKADTLNQPVSFRSFKSNQSVVLKDGQSTQLTMATDKVTGEVLRAEVSLTVVK